MKKTSVAKHFDKVAAKYDSGKSRYSYYYDGLKCLLKSQIPDNKRVFELGCGTGDLLVNLKPKYGFGMDISNEMIFLANKKHKFSNIKFSTKWPAEKFEYIFMSDVIEHLEKPKDTFDKIHGLMGKNTVFVNTMANPTWEPLLMLWENMGWKMKEGPHTRIGEKELKIIMKKAGLKVVKHGYKLLMPINIPVITNFVNAYLEKYFKKFSFIEYFVAVKI